jgi:hypothetical protein
MSMAEIQLQRIKSIYGEIAGILSQLPLTTQSSAAPGSVGIQYNAAIDELTSLTNTDYARYKLTTSDAWMGDRRNYDMTITRTKMGSVVRRLEEEYGLGANASQVQSSPVVVTVNQNQQVTISVTPIQNLIDSTEDEVIRQELTELKEALEINNNSEAASGILNSIQQKSWEIFIKVLPYVLEHLGHLPR